MDFVRPAAALLAAGLLAACAPGADTVAANPEAAADDSLVQEGEADNPMQPGAIDDATGTDIPGA
jgi:hypothetical protein